MVSWKEALLFALYSNNCVTLFRWVLGCKLSGQVSWCQTGGSLWFLPSEGPFGPKDIKQQSALGLQGACPRTADFPVAQCRANEDGGEPAVPLASTPQCATFYLWWGGRGFSCDGAALLSFARFPDALLLPCCLASQLKVYTNAFCLWECCLPWQR